MPNSPQNPLTTATLPEVGIRPRTTNHTFFYDYIRHSRLLSLLPTHILHFPRDIRFCPAYRSHLHTACPCRRKLHTLYATYQGVLEYGNYVTRLECALNEVPLPIRASLLTRLELVPTTGRRCSPYTQGNDRIFRTLENTSLKQFEATKTEN